MIIHNENQGGEYAGKKYETKSFPDVTGKVFVGICRLYLNCHLSV